MRQKSAIRRRKEARNGYSHIHARVRPRYSKTAAEIAKKFGKKS